jgi:prevent-host-death family protein
MIREAPAMTVRQNLAELLTGVQDRGESVLITRRGRPVAAIVDLALYERISRMERDFERLCGELAQAGASRPEAEVAALVSQATREARRAARSYRKASRSRPGTGKRLRQSDAR